jgi:hypothetical protein
MIDTWTMPRSSSAIPMALTKRNPPELWRMALRSSSRRRVDRVRVDVEGDEWHSSADHDRPAAG